jgi:hypothetical protein
MENTKLSLAVSLHFAVFAAGAAANSSVGAAFVFGGLSAIVLAVTLAYEIFVDV